MEKAPTKDTDLLVSLPVLEDGLYWRVSKQGRSRESRYFVLQVVREAHGTILSVEVTDPAKVAREKELAVLIKKANEAYDKARKRRNNSVFFHGLRTEQFYAADRAVDTLADEKRKLRTVCRHINAEILLDAAFLLLPELERLLAKEEVERVEEALDRESDKFVGDYPPLNLLEIVSGSGSVEV